MKYYYLLGTDLGYTGTDNLYLVEEDRLLSESEMDNYASSQWWQDFDSSGAVFEPHLAEAVEAGDMTEEEMEEELENALHGMICYEEGGWMTLITKENLYEMMEDFRGKTHEYTVEKEEEIRKSFE